MKKVLFSILFIFLSLLLGWPLGYTYLKNTYPANGAQLNATHTALSPPNKSPPKIGIYLINLDRSPERLAFANKSIDQLPYAFTRISAVDGKKLPQAYVDSIVDKGAFEVYTGKHVERGTIGCSLSHIKAWQAFLASDNDFALILEDDIGFNAKDMQDVIAALLDQLSLWDLVNFENLHRSLSLTLAQLPHQYSLELNLTSVTHAGAYLIKRSTAQSLVDKALPLRMPADHYFNRPWELGFRFTSVKPNLAEQAFGTSIIDETRTKNHLQYSPLKRVYIKTKRIIVRVQSDIMRFVTTLKDYFTHNLKG